jgi:hypothetical protein
MKTMEGKQKITKELHEELTKFEMTMQELRLMKLVATDLKNYRRMITLKKYD